MHICATPAWPARSGLLYVCREAVGEDAGLAASAGILHQPNNRLGNLSLPKPLGFRLRGHVVVRSLDVERHQRQCLLSTPHPEHILAEVRQRMCSRPLLSGSKVCLRQKIVLLHQVCDPLGAVRPVISKPLAELWCKDYAGEIRFSVGIEVLCTSLPRRNAYGDFLVLTKFRL